MIEKSTRTITAIIAAVLLLSTTSLTSYHAAFAATAPTGVLIPLYSYPGSYWTQVIQAKNAHPSVPIVAVINPNNGPSTSSDPNYVSGIQQLQAAGVIVLGYVDTTFATKSITSAETEITHYNTWYHVNGIFFDDMQNVNGYQTYYSTLSTFAKSLGMTMTLGNPGTSILSSYLGSEDNLCIFENNYEPTVSDLQSNTMGDPKTNFSFIAYEVGLPSQSFINSIVPYVSYMYATDDGSDGNPYDSVPSYLDSLVAELASANGASTTTVPGSPTGLSATASSSSQINLGWTAPSNNGGSAINGYKIERSTDSGSTWSSLVSNTGSTSTAFSDSGLAASTAYTYRVSAINSVGTSTPSATASATTSASAPSTIVSLAVDSSKLSGAQFSGMWVELHAANGTLLQTGYTPVTFSVQSGSTYVVYAADYNRTIFNHWGDGNTNSSLTITANQNTTLTAYYSTPATITVKSVDSSGTAFSGMWTVITSNGQKVASGYTAFKYSSQTGNTYQVTVSNYQNYVFSHWSNGSTNPTITVTPTSNTTLVAYYST